MNSSNRSCLAIVLAAGEGSRMKSRIPKVLHEVAGRSMLGHVLAAVGDAGADKVAVVIGPNRQDVADEAARQHDAALIFTQTERLGTAHAVLAAKDAIAQGFDDILIAYGDTPLLTPDTFRRMRAALNEGAAVVALGFNAQDPSGYGRLITDDAALLAIREDKDATDAEKAITFCNAGLMALSGGQALALLSGIDNTNAKGEYYLTDIVEMAGKVGLRAVALEADESEVQGVNDRTQLAAAEAVIQRRLRTRAMAGGATLIAPDTVYFSHDTQLGRDVVVEPHVVFGPGVSVSDGAIIHAFSHLEGASVGAGASVGPYGRLRPGAQLKDKARIGNFVEIKNAVLEEGAKVNHLTYIGDAQIGAGANIGAGTITCNYDGFNKMRTVVGAGAFVGSNSSLVAPVTIGEGAYVGSGSVVTMDVPPDALAVARGRQTNREGWAKLFREKFRKS